MGFLFSLLGNYYYIVILIQGFCAFHSYRRGTLNKWIYLIIFLPFIGGLIYLYSEVLPELRYNKSNIDIGAVINPSGKIKKMEDELRFTDTFANKVKLADAYLASGQTTKAINLYESSLNGAFSENEHVLAQLIIAYYQEGQFDKIPPVVKKIYNLTQFTRSKAHLIYAKALENLGEVEAAENEFKKMKGRFSYYEARYEYGLFLIRNNRRQEAFEILNEILNEEPHLSRMEKNANRVWFSKTREEVKSLAV